MTQPPGSSEPEPASDPGAAPVPLPSYGRAPDPSSAYPDPTAGTANPLPDLVPDEHAPPGPGYGPPEEEPREPDKPAGPLRRLWSRLSRR